MRSPCIAEAKASVSNGRISETGIRAGSESARQLESNGIAAVRQAFAETVCKGVVTGQAVGKTERSYECDSARGKHACGPQDDQSQRKAGRYHAETAYGAAVPLGLVKVSHDCSVFV